MSIIDAFAQFVVMMGFWLFLVTAVAIGSVLGRAIADKYGMLK